MDLQQIKQEAAGLSHDDRLALQAFLLHLSRVDDPTHCRVLGERLRSFDAGDRIDLAEFICGSLPEEADL